MKRVSESSLEVEKKRQTTVTHLNKFADPCNVCCVLCPLLPSINFSLSLFSTSLSLYFPLLFHERMSVHWTSAPPSRHLFSHPTSSSSFLSLPSSFPILLLTFPPYFSYLPSSSHPSSSHTHLPFDWKTCLFLPSFFRMILSISSVIHCHASWILMAS